MAHQGDNQPKIIIRKVKKITGGGHHGGAWKVAYADFVTAMMAFFMLLWLISNPDEQKLKGLAEYFSPTPPSSGSATGENIGAMEVPSPGGHTQRMKADSREGKGEPGMLAASPGVARGGSAEIADGALRVLAQEMKIAFDSLPQRPDATPSMQVEQEGDAVRISLMDNDRRSMFAAGSAVLNGHGRQVLQKAAQVLRDRAVEVSVEGHSDGGDSASAANWRLSAERALAARMPLIVSGVDESRLGAIAGFADSRPVYPGEPGRAENRRIVLVIRGGGSALPANVDFAN